MSFSELQPSAASFRSAVNDILLEQLGNAESVTIITDDLTVGGDLTVETLGVDADNVTETAGEKVADNKQPDHPGQQTALLAPPASFAVKRTSLDAMRTM